jgi:hypothetical protein
MVDEGRNHVWEKNVTSRLAIDCLLDMFPIPILPFICATKKNEMLWSQEGSLLGSPPAPSEEALPSRSLSGTTPT